MYHSEVPIINGKKNIKNLEKRINPPEFIISSSRRCFCEVCDYCASYESNEIKIIYKFVGGRYVKIGYV